MDLINLRTRSLSSIVIGGSIIGCTLMGSLPSAILVLVITCVSTVEFVRINQNSTAFELLATVLAVMTLPLSALYFMLMNSEVPLSSLSVAIAPMLLAFAGVAIFTQGSIRVEQVMRFATSLLLFGLSATFAFPLISEDPRLLLAVFFLLWGSDVGAYLVGSMIGKHKLAALVSPGKTWEGAVGGLIVALIVAYALSFWLDRFSAGQWLIIGALVSIFGLIGDLLQSLFKRAYGRKDSGTLIPGHGGFWDRFDSFFGCIAIVGIYMALN